MAAVHGPRNGLMAEMNMIPLIDVSLILLIIFMVMTPFLVQSQISVKLPKSSQTAKPSQDNVIRIEVASESNILVEGKRTSLAGLEQELILRLAKSSGKIVLVQADRNVPIQTVVSVFDTAKKLGAGGLGIGVTQESGK